MFRGSKEEDGTWSWKMIIGDKNQGALYDFGLGVKESGFTQLTNGELINMPKDEFIRKLNLVKELIELLISKDVNLVTEEKQIELYDANTNSIDELVGALDLLENNLDETAVNNTEARNTNESIIDMYYEIEALYEETKESLTDDIISEIEEILSIININNIKCYFAINEYCKNATKGFDLLVSEDGVNFQVITRNGFNDKYNHGLRTFQATEEGLFLGTANPFYGTQLWLLKDKDSFVEDDNNENPGDENDTPGEDSEISNDSTLKDTVEDSNKDQVIVIENQNNKDKQHNKLPVTGGINSAFVIVVAVILMMFGFKIYSYNRKQ